MIKFKVKSRISKYFFHVYVYDSLEDLRKDANEHDERTGHVQNSNDGVLGVVHHYVRERIHADGKIERRNDIGIIRLSRKHLSSEIVAHELAHASMWNYRLANGGAKELANFGNGCSDKEEAFAYIYGQMFRDLTNKLYKYNIWE